MANYFKNSFSNYVVTDDQTKLFYMTNFDPQSIDQEKIVLVFNYGLVCNFAHFEKQLPYFDELGFQVIIHDYRGHFRSSGEDNISSINFERLSKDLKSILDELSIHNTILIGHSMGVNISLEFAKLYPKNVLGMVLISGTVFPPHNTMFDSDLFEIVTPYLQLLSKKFPNIYQKIWTTSGMNPLMKKMVHDGGFNTKEVPIEFVEQYLNRIGKLKPELFFHCFELMKTHDIKDHLKNINTRTLIISGDKDQIVPLYVQDALIKGLSNSEFYLVKDGSHVPQVDFPETVNERLNVFIQDCKL